MTMETRLKVPSIVDTLASARSWATGTVQRLIGYGIDVYSSRGGGIPSDVSYETERALVAPKRNPWVYVCVQAISTDLASLPLVAVRGEGPAEVIVQDHWLPRLLKRPHPKTPGRKFRKQLVADLRVTGNAFVRVWRDEAGQPTQLARIPPGIPQAIVASHGEIVGWKVGQESLTYDEVLHMADLSFEFNDPKVVFGASPIEPLRLGLQVDYDSRKQAGRAAKRGRLEVIASPRNDSLILSDQKIEALTRNYDSAVIDGNGMFFVNQGIDVKTVSYTPREGEFLAQGAATKSEILATFQVPAVRAGDGAANYGTAKQQMRGYWESLVAWASIFDEEFSRLAEPGVSIRHQFSRVEALQSSYTERQLRAKEWAITFGMEPLTAARYEGFHDAPVPPGPLPASAVGTGASGAPSQGGSNGEKPDEAGEPKSLKGQLTRLLSMARTVFDEDREVGKIFLTAQLQALLERSGVSRAAVLADEVAGVCYVASDVDGDLDAVFGDAHAARIAEIA